MKTIEVTQYDDPKVLKLDECPMPKTRAGEVLTRVRVIGVNRLDVFQQTDNYPVPSGAPDILGLGIVGEIVNGDLAHIDSRYGSKVGDHVCALMQERDYAELCTAPLDQILLVSAGLSDVEAAVLPENYFIVWSNVFDRGLLGCGARGVNETLLVQGGSDGTEMTTTQIASALGYRVFVVAGSVDKCNTCARLGATHAINYRTEDSIEIVKAEMGPGADVVLDMVGGSHITHEIACIVDDGRIVLIVLLGGAKVEVPLGNILYHRPTLAGSTLCLRPVALKAAIAANLYETVWPLLVSGCVKPVVHKVMPAAQTTQVHTLMESSAHISKTMSVWDRSQGVKVDPIFVVTVEY